MAEDEVLERRAVSAAILAASPGIPGGIRVSEASNGPEALAIASNDRVDVAILDIRMPGLNGIDVARRLRKADPDLPVAFLTACDSFDFARQALRIGVDDYLLKPATDEEIRETVLGLLERNRAAKSGEELRRIRDSLVRNTTDLFAAEIVNRLGTGRLDLRSLAGFRALVRPECDWFYTAVLAMRPAAGLRLSPGLARAIHARVAYRSGAALDRAGYGGLAGSGDGYAAFVGLLPATPSSDPHADHGTGECPTPAASGDAGALTAVLSELHLSATAETGIPFTGSLAFPWPIPDRAEALDRFGDDDDPVRRTIALARGASPSHPVAVITPRAIPADHAAGAGVAHGRIVRQVLGIMTDRMHLDLSLEGTALELGVSPAHLSRLLARRTGRGFSDNLASIRIAKAGELLAGGMSVKEAGAVVGFKDPAYFSRVFRRVSGSSPARYRESHGPGCA